MGLTKKNEQMIGDIAAFSVLKSKFDSKVDKWDKKAETGEIKKIEEIVQEEVNKIKKEIDNMKEKNVDIQNQFKNKTDEKQDTISKNLENKLTENIKQIENNISKFENSNKDIASK